MHILLVLAILSVAGLPQSTMPKITCTDKAALTACRSFQDALADEGAKLVDALKRRDHVLVCFRPEEDVFLLFSYDSPSPNLQKQEDSPRSEEAGSVDLINFRNGFAGGESVFFVGQWTSPKQGKQGFRFSGQSLLPGDDARVSIDKASITVSHAFKVHFDGPITHYALSIEISSRRFVETFTDPGAATGHFKKEDSGECLILKE